MADFTDSEKSSVNLMLNLKLLFWYSRLMCVTAFTKRTEILTAQTTDHLHTFICLSGVAAIFFFMDSLRLD